MMTAWTYRITAAARPRLAMRVVQIFDQQLLEVDSFNLAREDAVTTIRIAVRCEEPLARRIHAKLYRLTDLVHIELSDGKTHGADEGELRNPSSPPYLDPLGPQP
jgi:hypothetical protein